MSVYFFHVAYSPFTYLHELLWHWEEALLLQIPSALYLLTAWSWDKKSVAFGHFIANQTLSISSMFRSKHSHLKSYSKTYFLLPVDPLNVYLNHTGVLCHDCLMMMDLCNSSLQDLQSTGLYHQQYRDLRCFHAVAETATTLWIQPT